MTVLWARTDDFESSPPYGDQLCAYYSVVPHDLVTAGYASGKLADFDQDGNPSPHGEATLNAGSPCAFAWRGLEATDVSARMTSAVGTQLPAFGASQVEEAGVAVRIQGGTVSGTGQDQLVVGADCYVLAMRGNIATNQVTFRLDRWKSGVRTALSTLGPLTLADAVFDGTKPFTLRLDAFDLAGVGAFLIGYLSNFETLSGPSPLTEIPIAGSASAPIFDPLASAVMGDGRVGFTLGQDSFPTIGAFSVRTAQKAYRFTVRDFSGAVQGGVLHDDDFSRQAPNAASNVVNDHNKTGRSVQGSFVGDLFYIQAFEAAPATADTIRYTPNGSTERRLLAVSQRPADDSYRQFPEIEQRWTAVDGAGSRFGVCCKATQVVPGTTAWSATTGYLAVLNFATQDVELYRINGSTETRLARQSFSHSSGAWYKVGLACAPQQETQPDAAQLLQVYVDDVQVNLTPEALAGISSDGSGGIVDATSDRIASGGGEGIAVIETTDDVVEWRNWTEGTIGSGEIPESDQATISLSDEGASEATLDYYTALLQSPIAPEEGWYVDRARFDSGHTIARAKQTSSRKRWPRLQTVPLTRAQREDLLAFWEARGGATGAFDWTSPEDLQTYKVHFLPGPIEQVELFKDVWVLSFGLEELR